MEESGVENEQKLLHQNEMTLLTEVIRQVARRYGLRREDAQDFEQTVHVILLQRNYDIFERFAGQSSLRTYLNVVVGRLMLDWQNRTYGKWRPSATAKRLGPLAIALERLVHRDHMHPSEAMDLIALRPNAPSRSTLVFLAAQLPARCRRRTVHLDAIAEPAGDTFVDPVEAAEELATSRQQWRTVIYALRQLAPEDRALVRARYVDGHSLKSLADQTGAAPPRLYRQLARAMRSLRRARLGT
jgi:RNA polymerase sigma factor (sigma-70 family)